MGRDVSMVKLCFNSSILELPMQLKLTYHLRPPSSQKNLEETLLQVKARSTDLPSKPILRGY